jgi:DNA recombination protein RmuC
MGIGLFLAVTAAFAAGLGIGYWVSYLTQRRKQTERELDFVRQKSEVEGLLHSWQTKYEVLNQAFEDFRKQNAEMNQNAKNEFRLMSQQLLEEKANRFLDLNQKNLFQILEPLKEKLKDFEKKVEETYSAERSERGVLRGEINKLLELNVTMSKEAHNLTQALKGENKTQGNWGEMVLENILERSGLRSGEEFIRQGEDMGLKGADGSRLQPDIIVNVPGNRHIIVDSKMTLKAYESYCSCEDGEREAFARLHIKSLEDHVANLSGKKYHLADKLVSPDFVILFMPLEPAFALAFKLKPEIFQQAWDKNIAIVSPTTLLTTLRTVATLWKQERQQRNALDIAKRGGLLYDKFAGLVTDLKNLGDKLQAAQKAHDDVFKKLSDGKGNLMSQVEELKELGVKAEKSLPLLEN